MILVMFLVCERQMNVNKTSTRHTLKSDLKKVDAHVIDASEYDELPEFTDEMFARSVVKKAGRPISENPRELISLRVPVDVLEKWRSTGPGWQTRMAQRLSRAPLPAGSKS
jgi:uncharacterized protein (DUF4415 family)